MKVIILGASAIGRCVARAFSQEEYDVIVVDSDQKVLTEISRELEVATLLFESPSPQFFKELSLLKPDLFFAATSQDELNLVACALAKNSGIGKTAALLHTDHYAPSPHIDLGKLFYVDHFVSEELLLAHNLYKRLSHLEDLGFAHFAHGAVWMRTVRIPDQWTLSNRSLQELKWPSTLIAGLIRRGEKVFFPRGKDVILPGDEVTLLGEAKTMSSLEDLFNLPVNKMKSVFIAGGGQSTLHLAKLLCAQHISVKIVEKNEDRCRKLAEWLPNANILCEDSFDVDFLREEGIEKVDAFVANEQDDADNLLLGSIGISLQCSKVIAASRRQELFSLFEKVGILPVASSRLEIINRLLSILHQKTFLSIGSLSNDLAKIVELKIPSSSKWAGSSIAEISHHLPKESLLGVIENHGRVLIGKGDSILCPDDRIIALCSADHLDQLHTVFGRANVPLD